jgi:hypothetical protein
MVALRSATTLLVSAVFVALAPSIAAATPAVSPRVTLLGGGQLGFSDHPDGGGLAGGFHLHVDLQVWWLILGATAGMDIYAETNAGTPLNATDVAAQLGATPPLYRHRARDRLHEIRARAALEIGRHYYSPDGQESESIIILGPKITYEGASRPVTFIGERAGLSYGLIDVKGNGTGVVFSLEVVRRADRHTVDLTYIRESCGGLFTKGCSSSPGMTTAGGRELSLVASVGFVIGR